MPLPDLIRNKVGNANRTVTEVKSIRLIVNVLTPSWEDDNAKNIGFEVVVVLFLILFCLIFFSCKENQLKLPKGLTLFTFISKFYTYGSQTNESKENMQIYL